MNDLNTAYGKIRPNSMMKIVLLVKLWMRLAEGLTDLRARAV